MLRQNNLAHCLIRVLEWTTKTEGNMTIIVVTDFEVVRQVDREVQA